MPELPEVEGARKLVEQHCQGKMIARAVVAEDEKVINDVPPKQLEAALAGRRLVAARRRGKQMWWELDAGPAVLVHFGMTGGLVIKGIGAAHYKSFHIDDSTWPPKYCKLELEFTDGTQLAFCDSRRFARVRFLESPETRPPISELGWDPMLDWPPLQEFAARLGGQRRAIKAVLLDQSFSAGVGNWVADEVLYQARIHPEQPANSIPAEQVAALHRCIREVCQLACSVDADAERFPGTWLFHYRWGKGNSTKSKIGGHTIDHITVGGRTSAYVPALQKLSKAAIAAAAANGGGKKAAGGRKRQQKGAAGGSENGAAVEAEAAAAAVAEAGAEAAVAVAQGRAGKQGSGRGRSKRAAAQQAADVADVVQAAVGTSGEEVQPRGKAGRGRQSKQQEDDAEGEEGPNGAAAAPTAGGAAGRGAKRFRGQQAAAGEAAAKGAAARPSSGAAGSGARGGRGKAARDAAPAAGRKRKAAADDSALGKAAPQPGGAVRARRGKAG